MSDRYFVKPGTYRSSEQHTWYVKENVPGHYPYIIAICNHEDDARLVRKALNEYEARVAAELVAAKTVERKPENGTEAKSPPVRDVP